MNCNICGKPVELVPSAAHRARMFGETPAYYTALFPQHAACALAKRKADVAELILREYGSSSKPHAPDVGRMYRR